MTPALLPLILACAGDPAAPPPAPAAPHDATPHSHTAQHGGEVQMAGDVHVEAVFAPGGVMVWLRDADEKPLAPDAFAGSALISGPAGTQTAPLAPMGEHLHAQVSLELGKPAQAVLTLPVGGKPRALRFAVEAVGMAEHDHTSLHGGVVSMSGDVHVEYVLKDGQHRFYISDARRAPITAGISGAVKIGEARTPLTADPAAGLLYAPAAGPDKVMLEAEVGGKPVILAF